MLEKHMYIIDCHDMTLAVKVVLNPNATKKTVTHMALDQFWKGFSEFFHA